MPTIPGAGAVSAHDTRAGQLAGQFLLLSGFHRRANRTTKRHFLRVAQLHLNLKLKHSTPTSSYPLITWPSRSRLFILSLTARPSSAGSNSSVYLACQLLGD